MDYTKIIIKKKKSKAKDLWQLLFSKIIQWKVKREYFINLKKK